MANELQISVQGESLAIYAIVRRFSDQKVWSITGADFVAWVNADIDNYDVALTASGGDLYTGDFPTAIATGTRVIVFYYRRVGANPAITDTLLTTRDQTWNGVTVASGSGVSLEAGVLTTLDGVKRQLRLSLSATTYDTHLTELINSVSKRIKLLTGRDFTATDYYEWHSGNYESELQLKQYPVLNINRVATDAKNGFSVTYGGSAITAHIQVQTTGVRLRTLVAAGTATTTTLTFTANPTISTIVTAINAIADWTATLRADSVVQYLHVAGGINVKGRTHDFTFASEDESEYRVDYATGRLGFTASPDWWNEQLGGGDPFGGGRVHTTHSVSAGFRNVLIEYRAGYETIPADVDQVAREIVADAYNLGLNNGNMQTESLGSYSYTLAAQVEIDDRHLSKLRPLSRLAVA